MANRLDGLLNNYLKPATFNNIPNQPVINDPQDIEHNQAEVAPDPLLLEKLTGGLMTSDKLMTNEQLARTNQSAERWLRDNNPAYKMFREPVNEFEANAAIPSYESTRKYQNIAVETGKAITRGTYNVASGLAGTASAAKGLISGDDEGGILKELSDWADKRAKDPYFAASKKGGVKGFIANAVGETLPFMASSALAGSIFGGGGAFGVGFAVEGESSSRSALEQKATKSEAMIDRILVGTINGALNKLQVDQIFKAGGIGKEALQTLTKSAKDRAWQKMAKQGGKFSADLLFNAASEGIEEALQEISSIYAPLMKRQAQTPEPLEALRQIGQAGLGGAVAGGLLGAGGSIGSNNIQSDIITAQKEQIPQTIQQDTVKPIEQSPVIDTIPTTEQPQDIVQEQVKPQDIDEKTQAVNRLAELKAKWQDRTKQVEQTQAPQANTGEQGRTQAEETSPPATTPLDTAPKPAKIDNMAQEKAARDIAPQDTADAGKGIKLAQKYANRFLTKNNRKSILAENDIELNSKDAIEFNTLQKQLYAEYEKKLKSNFSDEQETRQLDAENATNLTAEERINQDIREIISPYDDKGQIIDVRKSDILEVAEDEISKIMGARPTGRSNKSEARYWENVGKIDIRLASHDVAYKESDKGLFIGVGNSIQDADIKLTENMTSSEIRQTIRKAFSSFNPSAADEGSYPESSNATPKVAPAPDTKPVVDSKTVVGKEQAKPEVKQEYAPIQEVEVAKIGLSKDVPNFKEGADDKTGVVRGEELGGKYNRVGTAPIVVWERLNGDLEVITGRHRLDLAKRTGEKTIPTQIVKEKDGFDKAMALTFDAESNIMDEKGSVKDYVQYFKNTEIDEKTASQRGLLARAKGKTGFVIAKSATDDVYTGYINGQIPERKAYSIAKGAPNNENAQRAAAAKIKSMSADELQEYARILNRTKPSDNKKAVQGNLFGFDDTSLNEAELIAKEVIKEQNSIKDRILAVKGALKRPETAKKMGLEFSDEKSIQDEVKKLEIRLDDLTRVYTTPELYQEMRIKAGLEVKEETKLTPQKRQSDLLGRTILQGGASGQQKEMFDRENFKTEKAKEEINAQNDDKDQMLMFQSTKETPTAPTALNEKDAARLKELKDKFSKGGKVYSGLDPELVKDAIEITSLYIKMGYNTLENITKQAIKDFGESIRPYIKDAYEAATRQTDIGKANTSVEVDKAIETAIEAQGEVLPETVSARKADIAEHREVLGLNELPSPDRKTFQKSTQEALKQNIPARALRMAAEININPRALSDTETAGFTFRLAQLKVEYNKLKKDIAEEKDNVLIQSKSAELDRIEDEFDAISKAVRLSGTEKGRALVSQKLTINNDLSLISVKSRAKATKKAELTPQETKKFEQLTSKLDETNERIKVMQEQIDQLLAQRYIKQGAYSRYSRMTNQQKDTELNDLIGQTKKLLEEGCVN